MKRHRKLYPTKGTDCSDYCSGDPFADFHNPFQSPPPPPPFQDAFFAGDDHSDGVSASVIILFVLLSTLLLFLLYYIIVVKSCLGLCNRARSSDDEGEIAAEEDGLSAAEHQHDHPIWMIATAGLQQSVINSIAVAKYKKSEGLVDGTDCSVCLSEFRDGDTIRMLPKCSHAFHVACIDAWLRSHTNCPLCRANIVAPSPPPPQQSLDHAAVEIGGGDGSGEISAAAEDREVVRVPALGRSVSMDHEVVKGGLFGDQKREEKFWRMVRVSPVGMKKRSLSCGGMRFLSSSSMTRARSDGDSRLRLTDSILLPL